MTANVRIPVTMALLLLLLCWWVPLRAQDDSAFAGNFREAAARSLESVFAAETASPAGFAAPSLLAPTAGQERKSGFLGVVLSVLLPGMGELYADRFDVGKYPLIVEGALWAGLIGVNAYGNWTQADARSFAVTHAGVNASGKDDGFFVSIENYADLYEYNNQRLVERRLDDLYPDTPEYFWKWDSEANRTEYKDQRIKSDELHNAVAFFAIGLVANRVWSAIQSAVLIGRYNRSLEAQGSLLPDMQTTVTSYAGKADGLSFRFRFSF